MIYTWPANVPTPNRVQLRLQSVTRDFTSPYSMQVQSIDLMAEVWRMQFDIASGNSKVTAGAIEAMFDRLKGKANQIALWHFGRPVPQGTARGTLTLSAAANQLDNTVSISGSGTLLAGDMIGIGGQLCRVMANATLPGVVEVAPRMRAAKASGTSVTWAQPTANFILVSDGPGIDYMPGQQSGVSVEFIEAP